MGQQIRRSILFFREIRQSVNTFTSILIRSTVRELIRSPNRVVVSNKKPKSWRPRVFWSPTTSKVKNVLYQLHAPLNDFFSYSKVNFR